MNLKEKMLKSKYCFVIAEGENWCMLCTYDKQGIIKKYTYLGE